MLHNRQFVLDSCNLNHTNNDLSIAGKPNKISMEILAVEKSGVDTISSITLSNLTSSSSSINFTYSQIKQYVTNSSGIGVGFEFDLVVGTSGAAHTLSVVSGGTNYSSETGAAVTGGNGSGLTVDTTVSTGEITAATVNAGAGGNGYKVGDIVTVSTGDGNATLEVTKIVPTVSIIIKQRGYGYKTGNVVLISIPDGYNGIESSSTADIEITVGDVVPSILDIQSTVLGNFRLLTGTKMTYEISPCSFRPDNIRMDVFYAGEDGSLHYDVHNKTEELVSGSPSQSKPGFRIFINFNISFEPFHK